MYVMKLKYLIAPFVLAAAALCGCQETAEIHPVAYMTDAQKTVSKSVTIDTPRPERRFRSLLRCL